MLTLTRKVGQKILVGNEIEVLVREIRGTQVRLSIVAPPGLPVLREELHRAIAEQNAKAAATPTAELLEELERRAPPWVRNPTGPSRGRVVRDR